ncbi:MAG: hypothetical protein ACU84H_03525 [Gammaproteobacteria bacterium]
MFKQFGSVFRKAIQNQKIWTIFVATVICLPCAVKAEPINGVKVMPEFLNGATMPVINSLDALSGSGLSASQGQNQVVTTKIADEIRSDGGAKSGGCTDLSSAFLTPERKAMGSERCEKNTDEGYQCDGYCGLYLSIPMFLVALWAGTYVPNELLSRSGYLLLF